MKILASSLVTIRFISHSLNALAFSPLRKSSSVLDLQLGNVNLQNGQKTSRLYSSSETEVNFQLSSRLDGLSNPTVWEEFTPLALKYSSVNLGQGFPDWDPPPFAIEAMMKSVDNPKYGRNANQYTRSAAHLPLAQVLADHYTKTLNTKIDPYSNIATAVGCTNALFCALQGLLNKGDEVILLEPAFDIYPAQVKFAGGTPKYVPLRSYPNEDKSQDPDANSFFQLDFHELEAAISPKTKALILNTPHNPTGKIFSIEELTKLSEIIDRHPNVVVISDEVYEHVIFDKKNSPHISFASLPGMFDRTLTLSSSGKTFSATGWKVGWAVGPVHLTQAVSSVQQWVNFSIATPNQDAIAQCLLKASEPHESYSTFYDYLAADYLRKRNLLVKALKVGGINPVIPQGGFFIMGDTSNIQFPEKEYLSEVTPAMPINPMPRDWGMSRWMTKEIGVTAIPPSSFYDVKNVHLAKNLLRFAFCKGDDTIMEAEQRFRKYFN